LLLQRRKDGTLGVAAMRRVRRRRLHGRRAAWAGA
jgi:hypothetical protein